MKNIVNNRLNDEAYKLLDLPTIEFEFGGLEFFNKNNIDNGQAGFRYNSSTGEKIDEWVGDDYIVVGYDTTVGCGPDPYIIKLSDPKLPVYHLVSDGGDWSNPDLVCDSLINFNKIINLISNYSEYLSGDLTSELKEEIINKIYEIENINSISNYWDELLDMAMPVK